MSPLWVAVCWGHSLLIRCKNGHVSRPSHGPSTPLDTHTGRTVHDYMSQNVKRSPLSSYHLKHSTIVEHSDASTCPCASIARASQWSSQCSLTSELSGMYGWTRGTTYTDTT